MRWLSFLLAIVLLGCQSEAPLPLVGAAGYAPSELEVGDRFEIRGSGFPVGKKARLTFSGRLSRPGQATDPAVNVVAEADAESDALLSVRVTDQIVAAFSGTGADARHATFHGSARIAFAPAVSGAPPVGATLADVHLNWRPLVDPETRKARQAVAVRVLEALGVTVDANPHPHGLRVERVEATGEAARIGMMPGDLLVGFAGVDVSELADVGTTLERTAELRWLHGETERVAPVSTRGMMDPSAAFTPAFWIIGIALFGLLIMWPAPFARFSTLESTAAFGVASGARWAIAAGRLVSFALAAWFMARGGELAYGVALVLLWGLFLRWREFRHLRGAAGLLKDTLVVLLLAACAMALLGAFRLDEIEGAQGVWPWRWSACRHPAGLVLLAGWGGLAMMRDPIPSAQSVAHDIELWMYAVLGSALFLGGRAAGHEAWGIFAWFLKSLLLAEGVRIARALRPRRSIRMELCVIALGAACTAAEIIWPPPSAWLYAWGLAMAGAGCTAVSWALVRAFVFRRLRATLVADPFV